MITRLDLKHFKCFELLQLPLGPLTLLSGSNASGKSSVLQALVLLHQTMREQEWSRRLMLNGTAVRLGTVADVVDKVHGRQTFEIGVVDNELAYLWTFSGERSEMSMAVDRVAVGGVTNEEPELLRYLLPPRPDGTTPSLANRLRAITYITAERVGPREVYTLEDRQIASVVGPVGEHAVSVLHWGRDEHVLDDLVVPGAAPTRLRQVEERMKQFFPGCALVVQQVAQANAVTLGLRTSQDMDFHRPIHAGFGLTQIFPIVVAALSASREDILLIENPEVHLHPAGQALMGQFLAAVARAGVQVVVETHSDHVLNGIRRFVKAGRLLAENTAIHFFKSRSSGGAQVLSPILDGSGNIDSWPDGFFDQFDKDMNHFAGWESEVELLVNDLSIQGQFQDSAAFRGAIQRVMAIRQVAGRFGRALHCHRNMAHAQVTPTLVMPQAIQALGPNERRALMQWLTQQGPFWDDARNHLAGDYLECNGEVVTDTAVGEAAYCRFQGNDRRLVSLIPSSWQLSPVRVTWLPDGGDERVVDVHNHWDPAELESVLQVAPTPLDSWAQLESVTLARCPHLSFSASAFHPLRGYPFVPSAAKRIQVLLDLLNRFKTCFDHAGHRTAAGNEIYQNFFTGGSLFSDSSAGEKETFEAELTFQHPQDPNLALFCPWHGKVRAPQLRIHFSWPVRADSPLYIVYVGPKITKS